ncbi:F-box/FBD/LRR-repeat protein At5g22660 [Beta vulgaris subsp. vulgaris]|uniref:F-box/FBD/LRR-repeat protein At5g22660 n=1 Tax=Beta vulgaris subsp. vulgaris TaxID=3555 RepID=UPI00203702BE|nr:F-box/FBD/LRR-repeat protein At5g22660 [Beta vulgaris subsp. vulgaris]XP_010666823.2 F-box/FBD/LRR-repeat protein At5g22660 [Beta vulgaris subsp. vulgaris]
MGKSNEEDKLSALPDSILTEILSRLPINSAAATTVLCHRWRHLWTGVTRLNLSTDGSNFAQDVDNILGQLTSPKISNFELILSSPMELPEQGDELEPLFLDIFRRNVEHVYIDVQCCFYEEFFWVPACLFTSQSLRVLELHGMLKFDLPEIKDVDVFQLPNLKRLKLDYVADVPLCLGILFKSCPLLEDLDLGFKLDYVESLIDGPVHISCPNLKSLRVDLESSRKTEAVRIHIDAPKLTNLDIKDCFSFYYFVQNPITLARACVDLRRDDWESAEDEDEELAGGEIIYLQHMSTFIRGMSSVSNLDLKIESSTNILAYLNSMDDGFLQMFSSLTHFETTLNFIGLNGWKDFLLSLQCFPNLKHLKVKMEDDPPLEHNKWCVPNCVPDCLVSTLNIVHISGLHGSEDDLKLLEYVLSNANNLEELYLQMLRVSIIEEQKADAMWQEFQFCKSLFKLPRGSSTCKILFSGNYVTTSSNDFKRGRLTCQVQVYLGD